ncbi:Peroxisomal hydratase-dehydrogenase-epimerase [Cyphellophora attinorum]|uniref:Peroxisomal hydratase-dehydrogenase-epimerase n=1 Tax=Cyphellophora attinorum TaxID=1664694 RepID=A0A0N1GYL7_9EURO|nr:Peroxisomal hydratase-dehydrogenase-epimerase [Phialophora attinorum]KPI35906.1 Peroxisomal hydratase-dehydrogenase-epimerase [Phialophora attinorum]
MAEKQPQPTEPPKTISLPSILPLRWTTTHTITPTSIITYNLALSAPATHLPHVYEGHPQFQPLPTYAAVFCIQAMGQVHNAMHTFLPNFKAHNHVHGEHWLELHRSYPTSGKVVTTARVLDVVAQKRGVLVAVEVVTRLAGADGAEGEKICTQEWTSFVLQVPGVGANTALKERGPRTQRHTIPSDRQPDATREYVATAEQGALYRAASGDLNPLHIDPETASRAGFRAPIMTGTCTIGVGVRLVMEVMGQGKNFESVKCRLSRPVFAGDRVRVEMWRVEDGLVVYRMVVDEEDEKGGMRQRVVIDGAGLRFVGGDVGGAKL